MARRGGGGGGGGIGGSGIYGGVGSGVVCDSKDTSMYCTFTKIVSVIMNLFIVGFIFYFVIQWIMASSFGRKIFRGRSK
jgi:hypothetical protein